MEKKSILSLTLAPNLHERMEKNCERMEKKIHPLTVFVAIFGAGAIFQLLVLAILAIFWRIRFWHFFQLLVLAILAWATFFSFWS
jgi:hypothetical protein